MCGDKGMCFRATWAEIKSMQKPKVELSLPPQCDYQVE